MALKYLIPSALSGGNADDQYLHTVLKFGDTTENTAQVKALKTYGVISKFGTNGTRQFIQSEIDKGFPVGVGFLHHGPSSRPRGSGHWILCIGYTPTHIVCHDPYGELDNLNGGYVRVGSGGQQVQYSWQNWLPRWMVDGPGTGWYLTYRPETPQVKVAR